MSWADSGKDLAEPFHVFLEALLIFFFFFSFFHAPSPELGFWIKQELHCSPLRNCHHSASWVTPNMPIRFNEALFIQTTRSNASLFQLLYPQAKLPVTRRSEIYPLSPSNTQTQHYCVACPHVHTLSWIFPPPKNVLGVISGQKWNDCEIKASAETLKR